MCVSEVHPEVVVPADADTLREPRGRLICAAD